MAGESVSVRVAAARGVHIREANRDEVAEALAALEGDADLLLFAGDLTTHGEPEQAELLAEACRPLSIPIVTVLGNHDCHADRTGEVRAVLDDAGLVVLERECSVQEVGGTE